MMREVIKAELKQRWAELVADGNMTEEELRQSLQDQVDGYLDLSMDEIQEQDTERMGWEYGDMTDEQMDEWTEIVNEAAREYLSR